MCSIVVIIPVGYIGTIQVLVLPRIKIDGFSKPDNPFIYRWRTTNVFTEFPEKISIAHAAFACELVYTYRLVLKYNFNGFLYFRYIDILNYTFQK